MTTTVMIRGLPDRVTEEMICARLAQDSILAKEIRLVRDKKTGQSRGFAFVEFDTLLQAQAWMEAQQGRLQLDEDTQLTLQYSVPRGDARRGGMEDLRSDWMCLRCNGHNFRKRDQCYKCGASRVDNCPSAASDGSELVGASPCNTLVVRELDALTTEEAVSELTLALVGVAPKNCSVLRDPLTRASKCCALIEFESVTDSMRLVQLARDLGIVELDGKAVTVDYAKNTFKTIVGDSSAAAAAAAAAAVAVNSMPQASISMPAIAAPTTVPSASVSGGVGGVPLMSIPAPMPPQFAALALAAAPGGLLAAIGAMPQRLLQAHQAIQQQQAMQQLQMMAQLHQHQQQQQIQQHLQLQQHLQQQQQQQLLQQQQQLQLQTPPVGEAEQQVAAKPKPPELGQPCQPPDTSKFVKEPSSGYYLDQSTGLYYDPGTQYFFDSTRNCFLYWDTAASCYRDSSELQNQQQQQQQDAKPEAKKSSSSHQLSDQLFGKASSIQKDMERWAKQVNKQKNKSQQMQQMQQQQQQQQLRMMQQQQSAAPSSSSADAAFAMLAQMSASGSSSAYRGGPSADLAAPAAALEPAFSSTSAASTATTIVAVASLEEEEEKLLDWERLACLLCQRGFQNIDALRKHKELSQLHRSNLDQLSERLGLGPVQSQERMQQLQLQQQLIHQQLPPGAGDAGGYEYRDRAKERREKYGLPPPPATWKRRYQQQHQQHDEPPPPQQQQQHLPPPPPPPPQPPKPPSEDVGKKLLQKMGGWQEGQGLGRHGQGRVAPVEAEMRRPGVGLGAPAAASSVASSASAAAAAMSGSYKDKVKNSMAARYHEFDDYE